MNQLRCLLTVSLLLFSLLSCNQKGMKSRMPKHYTIEQLYNNQWVRGAGFNTDESKILINNNTTGIYNVYELNIADTTSRPLTSSIKESFFAVSYLSGSSKFIYAADSGGNENT